MIIMLRQLSRMILKTVAYDTIHYIPAVIYFFTKKSNTLKPMLFNNIFIP